MLTVATITIMRSLELRKQSTFYLRQGEIQDSVILQFNFLILQMKDPKLKTVKQPLKAVELGLAEDP